MTTYALLNVIFLLAIGAGLLLFTRQKPKRALWYTFVIVLIMTALFDSIFIIFGLFEYNPDIILGVYIWKAPIEDFAYAVASVALVGLLWEYYEVKGEIKE